MFTIVSEAHVATMGVTPLIDCDDLPALPQKRGNARAAFGRDISQLNAPRAVDCNRIGISLVIRLRAQFHCFARLAKFQLEDARWPAFVGMRDADDGQGVLGEWNEFGPLSWQRRNVRLRFLAWQIQ